MGDAGENTKEKNVTGANTKREEGYYEVIIKDHDDAGNNIEEVSAANYTYRYGDKATDSPIKDNNEEGVWFIVGAAFGIKNEDIYDFVTTIGNKINFTLSI